MKKNFLLTTILLVFLIFPYEANSRELNINHHRQNTIVWCWAATIAMVVEYIYDINVEDCEVLSKYDISLGGKGACCFGDRQCVRTGQLHEMGHILGTLYGIRGRYIPYPPTYNQIKNSIDLNYPLIATLQQRNGSGHVVVISGYTNNNNVIVLDPMSNGKQIVNYNTLISNFSYGRWTGSFLIQGNRGIPKISNECVTPYNSCWLNSKYPIGSSCWCRYQNNRIFGEIY